MSTPSVCGSSYQEAFEAMTNNRVRRQRQGRREEGSFNKLPKAVTKALQKKCISPFGYKLLIDLFEQFNGFNNGDLSCSFSVFHNKGWKSKVTLTKTKRELIQSGFIEKTRQGLRSPPTCDLFAVTWLPIDDCNGKLEVESTRVASGLWNKNP